MSAVDNDEVMTGELGCFGSSHRRGHWFGPSIAHHTERPSDLRVRGLSVFCGASRRWGSADLVASFVANRAGWLRLLDRVVEEEVGDHVRGFVVELGDVLGVGVEGERDYSVAQSLADDLRVDAAWGC
jgi:hypothetical protein